MAARINGEANAATKNYEKKEAHHGCSKQCIQRRNHNDDTYDQSLSDSKASFSYIDASWKLKGSSQILNIRSRH